MKRGFAPILLIIGLIGLVLITGAAFHYNKKPFSSTTTSPVIIQVRESPILSPSPIPGETANWKTYINKTLRIKFKYPADWVTDLTKAKDEDLNKANSSLCIKYYQTSPSNCEALMYWVDKDIASQAKIFAQDMGITALAGDFGAHQDYPAVTETSNIVVDNKPGYKIKGTIKYPNNKDIIMYNFLIPLSNKTLVFGNVANETEMLLVLSTFKFTN